MESYQETAASTERPVKTKVIRDVSMTTPSKPDAQATHTPICAHSSPEQTLTATTAELLLIEMASLRLLVNSTGIDLDVLLEEEMVVSLFTGICATKLAVQMEQSISALETNLSSV